MAQNITIIGLGLMGASLGAACRKKIRGARITGLSRNLQALRWVKKNKWFHQATSDFESAVGQADLIVLCTPVNTFVPFLKKIDVAAKPGTLVTDVGSVKAAVLNKIRRLKLKNIHYVSAHPMVGSHDRGAMAARRDLYERGWVFLIKEKQISAKAFHAIRRFWRQILNPVLEISAQEHDRIVANVSHLPHLLAASLMLSVPGKDLRFAASGFKDTTRIAQGHFSVWLPIFFENRAELAKSAGQFMRYLTQFQKALKKGNEKAVRSFLAEAAKRRFKMSSPRDPA